MRLPPAASCAARRRSIIEHLKAVEKRYPGLDRVNMSMPVGMPLNLWLEQHERLAKEVMPAFKTAAKSR